MGTLGPVATIFLGYLFLDEAITPIQLAGAALVTTGVAAIAFKKAAPTVSPAVGG